MPATTAADPVLLPGYCCQGHSDHVPHRVTVRLPFAGTSSCLATSSGSHGLWQDEVHSLTQLLLMAAHASRGRASYEGDAWRPSPHRTGTSCRVPVWPQVEGPWLGSVLPMSPAPLPASLGCSSPLGCARTHAWPVSCPALGRCVQRTQGWGLCVVLGWHWKLPEARTHFRPGHCASSAATEPTVSPTGQHTTHTKAASRFSSPKGATLPRPSSQEDPARLPLHRHTCARSSDRAGGRDQSLAWASPRDMPSAECHLAGTVGSWQGDTQRGCQQLTHLPSPLSRPDVNPGGGPAPAAWTPCGTGASQKEAPRIFHLHTSRQGQFSALNLAVTRSQICRLKKSRFSLFL